MASVHKQPNGRWLVRYWTPDGEQRKQRFDRATDARAFAADIESAKAHGTFVDPRAGRIRFADRAEAWLEGKVNLRPATRAKYRSLLDNHLVPTLGKSRLARVERKDVQALVADLNRRGYSRKTILEVRSLLAMVFADAIEDGLIARTPVRRIDVPAGEYVERRFLDEQEVDRLAAAVPDLYQALILTGAYLGPRWEELAALKRARLDMQLGRPAAMSLVAVIERAGGTYQYVEHMKSKRARRTIQIPETIREVLAAHLAGHESEWVFPAPEGGFLHYNNFRRRVWIPAAIRTGFGKMEKGSDGKTHYVGLTFHALRHTAAAFMIAGGADAYLVMRRHGHEDVRTTYNLYGHLLPDREEGVNAGLDARFRSARVSNACPANVVELPSGETL